MTSTSATPAPLAFPLFDLDRVEVLRGPQGTLWGKNTTGGAVSVVSRKPTFGSNDGELKLDYGSFNDKLVEGASNGVIWSNHLAGRASFHYESRDGRFTNLYDGRHAVSFRTRRSDFSSSARSPKTLPPWRTCTCASTPATERFPRSARPPTAAPI
jgi:outer membrane receptor protein involved in Fe transport